ncbi:Helicase SEN1 [Papilio machaon]|uniref:Helicase SEN1 n=1 Tax=Papilio machaon TaxID=76193 RepID=A0A194QUK5_PAPMA|nr:Helicase SEN1 [Papilio machaon]
MAKWKLIRQNCEPTDELEFLEGDEVKIGRGLTNTVTLSSIVVSRNHCVINFQSDKAIITDLKSSNGVFVGLKRISPDTPFDLFDLDIIGLGWTPGAPLALIPDNEKYVYKLVKVKSHTPIYNRIQFQNELDLEDDVEGSIKKLHNTKLDGKSTSSGNSKQDLKRKLNGANAKQPGIKKIIDIVNLESDCISISDSDLEICTNEVSTNKKTKLEPVNENLKISDNHISAENDEIQFEAYKVKQEYLGCDDEPIQISSDDDSESEQWFLRLSQSSPGKPFIKIVQNRDTKPNDNSYSQIDDFMILDSNEDNYELDEEIVDEDEKINVPSVETHKDNFYEESLTAKVAEKSNVCNTEANSNNINLKPKINIEVSNVDNAAGVSENKDETDGTILYTGNSNQSTSCKLPQNNQELIKKIKLIEPAHRVAHAAVVSKKEYVSQKSKTIKHSRSRKQDSRKKHQVKKQISDAQKEERKQKLKEIALKEKGEIKTTTASSINTTTIPLAVAKVTTFNRGVFLTDNIELTGDSSKKTNKIKDTDKSTRKSTESKKENQPKKEESAKHSKKHEHSHIKSKVDNKKYNSKEKEHDSKIKDRSKSPHLSDKSCGSDKPISVKYVEPLKGSGESKSGKPFSKVLPMSSKLTSETSDKKIKKKVSFSDKGPEVRVYEIEPGNKMKRTSLIKSTLLDVRHMPAFSLEKQKLMKILRWNANWLEEQLFNNDPPPILDHNQPLVILHSFTDHNQYKQLIGDLLLMEIWECLTQGYKKLQKEKTELQMQIDSLPLVPPQERFHEMYNMSVNLSLPTKAMKLVPRVGEILMISFGIDTAKCNRLLFVNNVRCLPSPPNNVNSFFAISLCGMYSEKMGQLRVGQTLFGKNLAYINKELMLFEAMDYLGGSPLSESILRPRPQYFISLNKLKPEELESKWMVTLNASQKLAVCSSVRAALGDRPGIQMVQGPPGTGKTSVICAIVMTYFYNASGRKELNRGKILICATSNAAVDELVLRLLHIRKDMPKEERFRMVRVGRAESMHPRARDVSSQQLAQRDALMREKPNNPGVAEEISHIEAKINMLRSQLVEQSDPSRVAYCETRIANLNSRKALLCGDKGSGGGGGGGRPDHLQHVEKRIIEGADIILTTLSSAQSHKMKSIKGRIALCIVDEAGQAIEPETLVPLTLDVTRITLIGDPQQLPGFICSQRARQHGLGESLFSRLSNCTEDWSDNPVVLLNEQYRMHPEIADYPNRAFYGGKIKTMTNTRVDLNIPPYCIVNIPSGDKGQGPSGVNEMEAWGVSRLGVALQAELRPRALSLAIITPYSAQRDVIRNYITALQGPFQGQERDVVVVSLARSRGLGFLTDAGRMNVMLTRAKHALLVCLNTHAIMRNDQWRTLVEDAQRRRLYTTLPSRVCQQAAVHVSHEHLLSHITQLKQQ